MKNEQKKISRFSGLAELAVSDEELEKITGGNGPPECQACGRTLIHGACPVCDGNQSGDYQSGCTPGGGYQNGGNPSCCNPGADSSIITGVL